MGGTVRQCSTVSLKEHAFISLPYFQVEIIFHIILYPVQKIVLCLILCVCTLCARFHLVLMNINKNKAFYKTLIISLENILMRINLVKGFWIFWRLLICRAKFIRTRNMVICTTHVEKTTLTTTLTDSGNVILKIKQFGRCKIKPHFNLPIYIWLLIKLIFLNMVLLFSFKIVICLFFYLNISAHVFYSFSF